MISKRYAEEFKIEAVKQITERRYPVAEVSARLGVSQHSMYEWVKKYSQPEPARREAQSQVSRAASSTGGVEAGHGGTRHSKKGRRVLCQRIPVRYAFIRDHEPQHSVRRMCRMMAVHPSGYYAWRASPVTKRQQENQRLLGLIKQSWLESGGVYGYRKITDDLRDLGVRYGKHRVYRLMRMEGLRSQTGYRRRPGQHYGRPSVVAPNHVQQQFDITEPNRVWVTDITYIRTHEGWLYLAAVLDLFVRQAIGWSMQPRMKSELAMRAHNLVASQSRRGNCHDNAVAESFFQLLKRERIRRRIYADREEARRDVFDYIEIFTTQPDDMVTTTACLR